jgi:hypothetical protein
VLINTVLNSAYKKEKEINIEEKMLLLRRVKIDKQEGASLAENEEIKEVGLQIVT